MSANYDIGVYYNDEQGKYVAYVQEFAEHMGEGETFDSAAESAEAAIIKRLEEVKRTEGQVPTPRGAGGVRELVGIEKSSRKYGLRFLDVDDPDNPIFREGHTIHFGS